MSIKSKERSLAMLLNEIGFPVFRVMKKDWRWVSRNFDSNEAVVEGHPLASRARLLLREVLRAQVIK
tara:strand:+ start:634 stop:834 length:201 start_codon:yes stop_codon:yes gene_type:complete